MKTLLECMAAWTAAETLKDTPCAYTTALALYRLRSALKPETEFYLKKERKLAETYGKRDADGQLAVRGGTVEFETQKALDEFRKARQELNETPAQTEFKPVQAPAPAMITPAQLEALEGFIEFEEGRTWDCRG